MKLPTTMAHRLCLFSSRRSRHGWWGLLSASLVAVGGFTWGTVPARAADGVFSGEATALDEAALDEAALDEAALDETAAPALSASQTYQYADLFAIDMPDQWVVASETDEAPQIVLEARPAPDAAATVRTEITWYPLPPTEVVAAGLQTLATEGYQVVDYGSQIIDNYVGIQVELTNLPGNLPEALLTYIGYDDVTVRIISYYAVEGGEADERPTPPTEEVLAEVHQSFRRQR